MKILAIERTAGESKGEPPAALLRAEAERVWRLQQEGIVREMYWHPDRREAVLVLECGGAAEADAILQTLPLVRDAWIVFEVMELHPYPGLARLFVRG
jgi:hypothetical protein